MSTANEPAELNLASRILANSPQRTHGPRRWTEYITGGQNISLVDLSAFSSTYRTKTRSKLLIHRPPYHNEASQAPSIERVHYRDEKRSNEGSNDAGAALRKVAHSKVITVPVVSYPPLSMLHHTGKLRDLVSSET